MDPGQMHCLINDGFCDVLLPCGQTESAIKNASQRHLLRRGQHTSIANNGDIRIIHNKYPNIFRRHQIHQSLKRNGSIYRPRGRNRNRNVFVPKRHGAESNASARNYVDHKTYFNVFKHLDCFNQPLPFLAKDIEKSLRNRRAFLVDVPRSSESSSGDNTDTDTSENEKESVEDNEGGNVGEEDEYDEEKENIDGDEKMCGGDGDFVQLNGGKYETTRVSSNGDRGQHVIDNKNDLKNETALEDKIQNALSFESPDGQADLYRVRVVKLATKKRPETNVVQAIPPTHKDTDDMISHSLYGARELKPFTCDPDVLHLLHDVDIRDSLNDTTSVTRITGNKNLSENDIQVSDELSEFYDEITTRLAYSSSVVDDGRHQYRSSRALSNMEQDMLFSDSGFMTNEYSATTATVTYAPVSSMTSRKNLQTQVGHIGDIQHDRSNYNYVIAPWESLKNTKAMSQVDSTHTKCYKLHKDYVIRHKGVSGLCQHQQYQQQQQQQQQNIYHKHAPPTSGVNVVTATNNPTTTIDTNTAITTDTTTATTTGTTTTSTPSDTPRISSSNDIFPTTTTATTILLTPFTIITATTTTTTTTILTTTATSSTALSFQTQNQSTQLVPSTQNTKSSIFRSSPSSQPPPPVLQPHPHNPSIPLTPNTTVSQSPKPRERNQTRSVDDNKEDGNDNQTQTSRPIKRVKVDNQDGMNEHHLSYFDIREDGEADRPHHQHPHHHHTHHHHHHHHPTFRHYHPPPPFPKLHPARTWPVTGLVQPYLTDYQVHYNRNHLHRHPPRRLIDIYNTPIIRTTPYPYSAGNTRIPTPPQPNRLISVNHRQDTDLSSHDKTQNNATTSHPILNHTTRVHPYKQSPNYNDVILSNHHYNHNHHHQQAPNLLGSFKEESDHTPILTYDSVLLLNNSYLDCANECDSCYNDNVNTQEVSGHESLGAFSRRFQPGLLTFHDGIGVFPDHNNIIPVGVEEFTNSSTNLRRIRFDDDDDYGDDDKNDNSYSVRTVLGTRLVSSASPLSGFGHHLEYGQQQQQQQQQNLDPQQDGRLVLVAKEMNDLMNRFMKDTDSPSTVANQVYPMSTFGKLNGPGTPSHGVSSQSAAKELQRLKYQPHRGISTTSAGDGLGGGAGAGPVKANHNIVDSSSHYDLEIDEINKNASASTETFKVLTTQQRRRPPPPPPPPTNRMLSSFSPPPPAATASTTSSSSASRIAAVARIKRPISAAAIISTSTPGTNISDDDDTAPQPSSSFSSSSSSSSSISHFINSTTTTTDDNNIAQSDDIINEPIRPRSASRRRAYIIKRPQSAPLFGKIDPRPFTPDSDKHTSIHDTSSSRQSTISPTSHRPQITPHFSNEAMISVPQPQNSQPFVIHNCEHITADSTASSNTKDTSSNDTISSHESLAFSSKSQPTITSHYPIETTKSIHRSQSSPSSAIVRNDTHSNNSSTKMRQVFTQSRTELSLPVLEEEACIDRKERVTVKHIETIIIPSPRHKSDASITLNSSISSDDTVHSIPKSNVLQLSTNVPEKVEIRHSGVVTTHKPPDHSSSSSEISQILNSDRELNMLECVRPRGDLQMGIEDKEVSDINIGNPLPTQNLSTKHHTNKRSIDSSHPSTHSKLDTETEFFSSVVLSSTARDSPRPYENEITFSTALQNARLADGDNGIVDAAAFRAGVDEVRIDDEANDDDVFIGDVDEDRDYRSEQTTCVISNLRHEGVRKSRVKDKHVDNTEYSLASSVGDWTVGESAEIEGDISSYGEIPATKQDFVLRDGRVVDSKDLNTLRIAAHGKIHGGGHVREDVTEGVPVPDVTNANYLCDKGDTVHEDRLSSQGFSPMERDNISNEFFSVSQNAIPNHDRITGGNLHTQNYQAGKSAPELHGSDDAHNITNAENAHCVAALGKIRGSGNVTEGDPATYAGDIGDMGNVIPKDYSAPQGCSQRAEYSLAREFSPVNQSPIPDCDRITSVKVKTHNNQTTKSRPDMSDNGNDYSSTSENPSSIASHGRIHSSGHVRGNVTESVPVSELANADYLCDKNDTVPDDRFATQGFSPMNEDFIPKEFSPVSQSAVPNPDRIVGGDFQTQDNLARKSKPGMSDNHDDFIPSAEDPSSIASPDKVPGSGKVRGNMADGVPVSELTNSDYLSDIGDVVSKDQPLPQECSQMKEDTMPKEFSRNVIPGNGRIMGGNLHTQKNLQGKSGPEISDDDDDDIVVGVNVEDDGQGVSAFGVSSDPRDLPDSQHGHVEAGPLGDVFIPNLRLSSVVGEDSSSDSDGSNDNSTPQEFSAMKKDFISKEFSPVSQRAVPNPDRITSGNLQTHKNLKGKSNPENSDNDNDYISTSENPTSVVAHGKVRGSGHVSRNVPGGVHVSELTNADYHSNIGDVDSKDQPVPQEFSPMKKDTIPKELSPVSRSVVPGNGRIMGRNLHTQSNLQEKSKPEMSDNDDDDIVVGVNAEDDGKGVSALAASSDPRDLPHTQHGHVEAGPQGDVFIPNLRLCSVVGEDSSSDSDGAHNDFNQTSDVCDTSSDTDYMNYKDSGGNNYDDVGDDDDAFEEGITRFDADGSCLSFKAVEDFQNVNSAGLEMENRFCDTDMMVDKIYIPELLGRIDEEDRSFSSERDHSPDSGTKNRTGTSHLTLCDEKSHWKLNGSDDDDAVNEVLSSDYHTETEESTAESLQRIRRSPIQGQCSPPGGFAGKSSTDEIKENEIKKDFGADELLERLTTPPALSQTGLPATAPLENPKRYSSHTDDSDSAPNKDGVVSQRKLNKDGLSDPLPGLSEPMAADIDTDDEPVVTMKKKSPFKRFFARKKGKYNPSTDFDMTNSVLPTFEEKKDKAKKTKSYSPTVSRKKKDKQALESVKSVNIIDEKPKNAKKGKKDKDKEKVTKTGKIDKSNIVVIKSSGASLSQPVVDIVGDQGDDIVHHTGQPLTTLNIDGRDLNPGAVSLDPGNVADEELYQHVPVEYANLDEISVGDEADMEGRNDFQESDQPEININKDFKYSKNNAFNPVGSMSSPEIVEMGQDTGPDEVYENTSEPLSSCTSSFVSPTPPEEFSSSSFGRQISYCDSSSDVMVSNPTDSDLGGESENPSENFQRYPFDDSEGLKVNPLFSSPEPESDNDWKPRSGRRINNVPVDEMSGTYGSDLDHDKEEYLKTATSVSTSEIESDTLPASESELDGSDYAMEDNIRDKQFSIRESTRSLRGKAGKIESATNADLSLPNQAKSPALCRTLSSIETTESDTETDEALLAAASEFPLNRPKYGKMPILDENGSIVKRHSETHLTRLDDPEMCSPFESGTENDGDFVNDYVRRGKVKKERSIKRDRIECGDVSLEAESDQVDFDVAVLGISMDSSQDEVDIPGDEDDAIPYGGILHGALLYGATPQGAISHGAIPHDTIPHGAIPHGTMLQGTMSHGTSPLDTTNDLHPKDIGPNCGVEDITDTSDVKAGGSSTLHRSPSQVLVAAQVHRTVLDDSSSSLPDHATNIDGGDDSNDDGGTDDNDDDDDDDSNEDNVKDDDGINNDHGRDGGIGPGKDSISYGANKKSLGANDYLSSMGFATKYLSGVSGVLEKDDSVDLETLDLSSRDTGGRKDQCVPLQSVACVTFDERNSSANSDVPFDNSSHKIETNSKKAQLHVEEKEKEITDSMLKFVGLLKEDNNGNSSADNVKIPTDAEVGVQKEVNSNNTHCLENVDSIASDFNQVSQPYGIAYGSQKLKTAPGASLKQKGDGKLVVSPEENVLSHSESSGTETEIKIKDNDSEFLTPTFDIESEPLKKRRDESLEGEQIAGLAVEYSIVPFVSDRNLVSRRQCKNSLAKLDKRVRGNNDEDDFDDGVKIQKNRSGIRSPEGLNGQRHSEIENKDLITGALRDLDDFVKSDLDDEDDGGKRGRCQSIASIVKESNLSLSVDGEDKIGFGDRGNEGRTEVVNDVMEKCERVKENHSFLLFPSSMTDPSQDLLEGTGGLEFDINGEDDSDVKIGEFKENRDERNDNTNQISENDPTLPELVGNDDTGINGFKLQGNDSVGDSAIALGVPQIPASKNPKLSSFPGDDKDIGLPQTSQTVLEEEYEEVVDKIDHSMKYSDNKVSYDEVSDTAMEGEKEQKCSPRKFVFPWKKKEKDPVEKTNSNDSGKNEKTKSKGKEAKSDANKDTKTKSDSKEPKQKPDAKQKSKTKGDNSNSKKDDKHKKTKKSKSRGTFDDDDVYHEIEDNQVDSSKIQHDKIPDVVPTEPTPDDNDSSLSDYEPVNYIKDQGGKKEEPEFRQKHLRKKLLKQRLADSCGYEIPANHQTQLAKVKDKKKKKEKKGKKKKGETSPRKSDDTESHSSQLEADDENTDDAALKRNKKSSKDHDDDDDIITPYCTFQYPRFIDGGAIYVDSPLPSSPDFELFQKEKKSRASSYHEGISGPPVRQKSKVYSVDVPLSAVETREDRKELSESPFSLSPTLMQNDEVSLTEAFAKAFPSFSGDFSFSQNSEKDKDKGNEVGGIEDEIGADGGVRTRNPLVIQQPENVPDKSKWRMGLSHGIGSVSPEIALSSSPPSLNVVPGGDQKQATRDMFLVNKSKEDGTEDAKSTISKETPDSNKSVSKNDSDQEAEPSSSKKSNEKKNKKEKKSKGGFFFKRFERKKDTVTHSQSSPSSSPRKSKENKTRDKDVGKTVDDTPKCHSSVPDLSKDIASIEVRSGDAPHSTKTEFDIDVPRVTCEAPVEESPTYENEEGIPDRDNDFPPTINTNIRNGTQDECPDSPSVYARVKKSSLAKSLSLEDVNKTDESMQPQHQQQDRFDKTVSLFNPPENTNRNHSADSAATRNIEISKDPELFFSEHDQGDNRAAPNLKSLFSDPDSRRTKDKQVAEAENDDEVERDVEYDTAFPRSRLEHILQERHTKQRVDTSDSNDAAKYPNHPEPNDKNTALNLDDNFSPDSADCVFFIGPEERQSFVNEDHWKDYSPLEIGKMTTKAANLDNNDKVNEDSIDTDTARPKLPGRTLSLPPAIPVPKTRRYLPARAKSEMKSDNPRHENTNNDKNDDNDGVDNGLVQFDDIWKAENASPRFSGTEDSRQILRPDDDDAQKMIMPKMKKYSPGTDLLGMSNHINLPCKQKSTKPERRESLRQEMYILKDSQENTTPNNNDDEIAQNKLNIHDGDENDNDSHGDDYRDSDEDRGSVTDEYDHLPIRMRQVGSPRQSFPPFQPVVPPTNYAPSSSSSSTTSARHAQYQPITPASPIEYSGVQRSLRMHRESSTVYSSPWKEEDIVEQLTPKLPPRQYRQSESEDPHSGVQDDISLPVSASRLSLTSVDLGRSESVKELTSSGNTLRKSVSLSYGMNKGDSLGKGSGKNKGKRKDGDGDKEEKTKKAISFKAFTSLFRRKKGKKDKDGDHASTSQQNDNWQLQRSIGDDTGIKKDKSSTKDKSSKGGKRPSKSKAIPVAAAAAMASSNTGDGRESISSLTSDPAHYTRPVVRLVRVNEDGTREVELTRQGGGRLGVLFAKGLEDGVEDGLFINSFHDKNTSKLFSGILCIGDEVLDIDGEDVHYLTLEQVKAVVGLKITMTLRIMPSTIARSIL